MELGQRIRQARLEAGLSQRQLCGDVITRNMLSLIENGSARPSMDTLLYLAGRLGKSVGYFLQEPTVSENQAMILQARQAPPEQAPELLGAYRMPDPVFDPEYRCRMAQGYLAQAQIALEEKRTRYAQALLEKAAVHIPHSDHRQELERQRLLLAREAGGSGPELARQLPDLSRELMLLAEAAMESGDNLRAAALLDTASSRSARWYFLRGQCHFALGQPKLAAQCYHQAEDQLPQAVWPRLEACYEALEDYREAYRYARLQRENP